MSLYVHHQPKIYVIAPCEHEICLFEKKCFHHPIKLPGIKTLLVWEYKVINDKNNRFFGIWHRWIEGVSTLTPPNSTFRRKCEFWYYERFIVLLDWSSLIAESLSVIFQWNWCWVVKWNFTVCLKECYVQICSWCTQRRWDWILATYL